MRDDTPTSMSALIPLESLLEKPARPRVNIEALREKLAAGRGPAFWRTLEEAAETDEMREYIEQEFPGTLRPNSARCRSPQPAEGNGGIACHGRRRGLHQAAQRADCSLRTAAGKRDSRHGIVLCNRYDNRRLRARPACRKPSEPSDQSGGKSRPSRKSRFYNHFRAGVPSEPVRPGPLADCSQHRPHEHLGNLHRQAEHRSAGSRNAQRRRLRDSVGHGHVAHPAEPDEYVARAMAFGQMVHPRAWCESGGVECGEKDRRPQGVHFL